MICSTVADKQSNIYIPNVNDVRTPEYLPGICGFGPPCMMQITEFGGLDKVLNTKCMVSSCDFFFTENCPLAPKFRTTSGASKFGMHPYILPCKTPALARKYDFPKVSGRLGKLATALLPNWDDGRLPHWALTGHACF